MVYEQDENQEVKAAALDVTDPAWEKFGFMLRIRDRSCGVFPAPTEAQEAVDVLAAYLLPDLQVTQPVTQRQLNTVVVQMILDKFSYKFHSQMRSMTMRGREIQEMEARDKDLDWLRRQLETWRSGVNAYERSVLDDVLQLLSLVRSV